MKRLLTSAVLFLCCAATSFAQYSMSGSGTENDPYLIFHPYQLNQLRNYLNQSGIYFKLMQDIDLTEFLEDENPNEGWQPVGTSSSPFKGIIDGNGHTISGLWINRPNSDYVGFFGSFYSGTVKNLTLKGGTIKGKNYVGLMSGADGDFIDCHFEGSVSGASYVGGATGYQSNFTRVTSRVDVLGTGDYVGGLSAKNGNFTSCSVTCNYVRGNNYVGGMCGIKDNSDNTFSFCDVHTNIDGNDNVGGLCGRIERQYAANMSNCYFIGNISANSSVGGLCGVYRGRAECKDCFVLGHIEAQGNEVGGLVGSCADNSSTYCYVTIDQCYFNGMVVGTKYVGGITGRQWNGKIKNCYTHASIIGTNSVGGICGIATGYSNAKSQLSDYVVPNITAHMLRSQLCWFPPQTPYVRRLSPFSTQHKFCAQR